MGSALPRLGLPSKANLYAAALEGLVQVNDRILAANPGMPTVYGSGAVWRNIPHDTWRRSDQIAIEGWGDCEGLASWRAAELRVTGEDPGARVGVYHTGPKRYHAIVLRGDDTIEDPSTALGMKVRPHMPTTREEMNRINGLWPFDIRKSLCLNDGCDSRGNPIAGCHSIIIGDVDTDRPEGIFFDNPDGSTQAQVQLPLGDGSGIIATTSPAVDKVVAAAKAANLVADTAAAIAKSPDALKQLAMLSPYTAAAMTLYSQPDINRALKRLGGGGKSLFQRMFSRG